MTSQPMERTHPVPDFAARLSGRLTELASVPVWSMTPDEQRTALRELARARAQLDALSLRVLAEAERSGATDVDAAASAADWLAVETRQVRREARSDLNLATALESHDVLAMAMAQGEVNAAQARAITTALDRLPSSGAFAVTASERTQAEEHLVALAAHHDAKALSLLGRRIFEVVAPDLAEAFEGRALAAEEAAALRRTTFSMCEDDEGTCHGRFRVPVLHGHILRTLMQAITNPARPRDRHGDAAAEAADVPREHPPAVRDGLAFCELLESIPTDALPRHGGTAVSVVVTMTLEQLMGGLGAAGVDTGARLSAGEARRLACRHGIIPAVLGSPSQILDLGRRRRLHTQGMRIAMAIRDRGCTAAGCEMPPAMCHAHHDVPWSQGGKTNVDHGRLLCGHHHRRIHDPRYQSTPQANGKISFHRRT